MLQENLLLKERMEKILPDWNITDDLVALNQNYYCNITEDQLNQIAKLGLFVSIIHCSEHGITITFSGVYL